MALSLCQMPLAVQEGEDPAPAEETALTEEIKPEEQAVPEGQAAPTETATAVSETAEGATASQQPTTAAESTGAVYTGTLGDNVAWSLDTASGALSIYGTGPMYDFNLGDSPLQDYRSNIKTVTIGGNVTSVGAYLFYQCTNLTVAVLGSSVTEIGKQAFCDCSSLSEVNIPYGVTSIGEYAFSGCKALTEIVLPDSVTSIGNGAFSSCSALTEIAIPSSVTEIGSNAFFSCRNLNTFITRGAVASVGYAAFDECPKLKNVKASSLDAWLQLSFEDAAASPARNARTIYVGDELLTDTDVVIPDTVTSINPYAFNNFTHFTSVYIPKSVKTIGKYAFSVSNCVNTTVKYAGSEEEWKQISIADNNGLLTGSAPIYYNQSPEKSCRITTAESEHGTVSVDNTLVKAGDTVTITAIPAPGYAVASYLVDGVEIPDGGNTFTATKDHEVSATFIYDVADDGKACGTLGENITWTLDTAGVLHIDGDGAIDDYAPEGSLLYPYRESVKSVDFSGRITRIGSYLFYGCEKLAEIVVPDSVISIGNGAFQSCFALTKAVIPDGVTSVGEAAFYDCSALTEVNIPNGITSIEMSTFFGCKALTEVVIPDSVTTIGMFVFAFCENLSTLTIGSGVNCIGGSAFDCVNLLKMKVSSIDAWLRIEGASPRYESLYVGDELLTDLVIPGTVKSIRPNAFYGCTSITSVYIPQSVKTVGSYAFGDMSSLRTVYYAGSQEEWSQISIDGGNELLTSSTPIYDKPLEGYCRITAVASEHGTVAADNTLVKAGDTVTITAFPAPAYAVASYLLDGVEIPDGGNTFTVTKDHVISATFTKVYDVADDGRACGTLGENITWALDTEGVLHIDGIGAIGDYKYGESPFSHYRESIKSVDFSDRITYIGANVFYECWKLTEIEIPDGVTSIRGYTFYGCSALTKVVIPDSVTSIENSAFYNCTALTEVMIPGSVVSIGNSAFSDCTALTKVVISDGVTSIEEAAFHNCRALEEVVIPDSVTSISRIAFGSCSSLTALTLGSGIVSIGESAFYSCVGLTKLVIPASVISIGDSAFQHCDRLKSAEFLGNAPESFGRDVFYKVIETPFMVFYHSGMTGWTSPAWNGYAAACIDPVSTDFSTLDDSNRNAQHVLFLLNDASMTATVGANTTDSNNAGYDGGYNGEIVIPDTVIKGESTYKVIGINWYAFANYPWVNTVTVGKNVSAIEPSAFRGCENLTAITVDEGNLQFADQDGVLFDKAGLYLYVYPAGRPADTYDIPDTCVTVGTQSFFGAANLATITVPGSVENIGSQAFSGCNALSEITLPFIGASIEDTHTFNYLFNNGDMWSAGGGVPQSLKSVTVLNANLVNETFYNCNFIENIYLPNCRDLWKIPDGCFYNCTALRKLVFNNASEYTGVYIPNTVTEVGENSFYNCRNLNSVMLGSGVQRIRQGAFYGCDSLVQFAVAKENAYFAADKWGVLYNKDLTVLRYYPSSRPWPYYNVAETTTAIAESAFGRCEKLVNLFIPKSVTMFDVCQLGINQSGEYDYGPDRYSNKCITSSSGPTVCCYKDSRTASYANSNGITAWYMDNYELQGLNIISLPEQLVFNTQGALTSVPYLTASYGDKTLQLDDYQVVLEKPYGTQTVTFTSGDYAASAQTAVVRQGDINGDSTTSASVVDILDLQCMYDYLATDTNTGSLDDQAYFEQVCDFNGDEIGRAHV